MPNRESVDPQKESSKRSLTEWLRALTRDLFQGLGEGAAGNVGWYAGLPVVPGTSGAVEAAEFSGQMSRLHRALNNPARSTSARSATELPLRLPQHGAIPRQLPADIDLPLSTANMPAVSPKAILLHANVQQPPVRPAGMA